MRYSMYVCRCKACEEERANQYKCVKDKDYYPCPKQKPMSSEEMKRNGYHNDPEKWDDYLDQVKKERDKDLSDYDWI